MRWVAIALAAVLVMAAGMGSAQTPSSTPPVKLALVIGNADYDGDGRIDVSAAGVASSESRGFVPDLRNPLNDAADIRDALQRIGFRVDHVVNADGARMGAALVEFGTKVAAAPDTAQIVVYYAGHAIQVDGANFLIPVKAQLPATDFSTMPTSQVQTVLRRVAVSTTEITEQLKQLRAPGVNLLMFDACRNNPWETRVRGLGRSVSATRGLAEIAAPPRTVIAFSTAPGRTADDGAGRNSPFAGVLKNWITKPGTVLQMLDSVGGEVQTATGGRQTPWFQSASVGQACLVQCGVASQMDRSELPPPPAPKTRPGEAFKECDVCPEMVVLPAGSFLMGSPASEARRAADENQRRVLIPHAFAVGRFEVTFAEWDSCAAAGGCAPPEELSFRPDDNGWGRANRPVIGVSWQDAKRYVRWLNGRVGGRAYRLLTEEEWEYAARAGTTTTFSTGITITPADAQYNHRDSYAGSPVLATRPDRTAPVGSFRANAFKLHDMDGNVREWVEDCYAAGSRGLTRGTDGAYVVQRCDFRVIRGGSWYDGPIHLRSASRGASIRLAAEQI